MDHLDTSLGRILCNMHYNGIEPDGFWIFEDLACTCGTVTVYAMYTIGYDNICVKWRFFMFVHCVTGGYQMLRSCLEAAEYGYLFN
jgi:hypothetical protein